MIALWIAFVLALLGSCVAMFADVISAHGYEYCFYPSEIHPDDEPYVPLLMQYIADGFLYIIDEDLCGVQANINYWALYLMHSFYVLYITAVFFTVVFIGAGFVYLFKTLRKHILRRKA